MRKCADWLKSYLTYTSGQESPDIFHMWCGISVIAASLGRGVWLDRAYENLHPNLYIVLLAGSAVSRKTTAIRIAERVVTKMGVVAPEGVDRVNIISDQPTQQSLIQSLIEEEQLHGQSVGYVIADEFSIFLGNGKDLSLIKFLTKAYDCPPDPFEYRTISRGKEVCVDLGLNILGGSTAEWLTDSIPHHAIGGGFTSRIIFVYQPPSGRKIAHPKVTQKEIDTHKDLVHDLAQIRILRGEFKWTKAAYDGYEDWYVDVFEGDRSDPALSGYVGRKQTTVLKVAMVLSVARGDTLEINMDDITLALSVLRANEQFLPHVMRLLESTEGGVQIEKVLGYIERAGKISHSALLRSVSFFMNGEGLAVILATLLASGQVQEEVVGKGKVYSVRRER